MAELVGGKFACTSCGKKYTWKPQLAGKRAKCVCGTMMTVPAAAPQAPPPPPPVEDDLYELAGSAHPPATPPPTPPIPAAAPSAAKTIAYRSKPTEKERDRFSFESITHAPRDLYVPTALLVAGFLSMFIWAIAAADAGTFGVIVVAIIATGATIIKTIVLILAAMTIAPMFGISFGEFRTAILKFAAIIVFTDAVGLWYDELLEMTGAISKTGRGWWRTTLLWLFLAGGIISVLCHYLFDMDAEETGYFAIPFALASLIIGIMLRVGAIVFLRSVFASATPPPAPPVPAAAPTSGAGPPAQVVNVKETALDKQIAERIEKSPLVRDAQEWSQRQLRRETIRPLTKLTNEMFASGARIVYFDLEGGKNLQPVKAYCQLPLDRSQRGKCIAAYRAYCSENKIPVDPQMTTDAGQKFLVVQLAMAANERR